MKKIIFSLVLLIFIVGCTPQEGTAKDNTPIVSEPETGESEPSEDLEDSTNSIEDTQETMQTGSLSTIKILGKKGFDVEELTIKKGDSVEWINMDPNEKLIVLTFQKDKGRDFINSEEISAGGSYTHNFDEAGTYDYWSLAYGVKAKIIVE